MKKITLLSLMLFCFSFAKSQCSTIYGMKGSGQPWSLISIDRYTGGYIILDTIPSIKNLVSRTQTIEPDSNRYVTFGYNNSNIQCIYTINFHTGKVLYQPVCDSSITEVHYDVKRKKIFAIMERGSNPRYQWLLITINPYNGSISVLDSITGMRNLVSGTSTIGIDSGRYFVMGIDSRRKEWLYALDETNGHIMYKNRDTNLFEFQYDTISKNIYCIGDTEISNKYKWFIKRINPTTGLVTTIDSIPGMHNLVAGTSAFAQDSLKYFVVGSDSAFLFENFYTLNALTGQTLMRPILGNGRMNYAGGTEYNPCNANCTNNYDEPICIVTVDSATNKSEVIWGRTNSPPASGSYNIYRDTGAGYGLINNQALSALSEYIDPTSDPSLAPQSYKLSTIDSCGESSLSAPHTSIYLTTTAAPNVYILSWTPYIGFTPSKYRIFRGPNMHSLVQIDSVPSNVLTYHDTLPPLGSIYLLEAVNPSNACIPTHGANRHDVSLAGLSGSFSNGFNTKVLTGINTIGNAVANLNIFPNPSNGMFTVQYSVGSGQSSVRISILNELGQVVFDKTESRNFGNITEQLNLQFLSDGIYTLRMQTDNGSIVRKLVLLHNR